MAARSVHLASAALSPMKLVWTVFFVSAGVLGFEVSCMRVLRVSSQHHFAFLVISMALLGFGASGSVLALLRSRVLPRSETVLLWLTLAAAASMPVCFGLSQRVPIDAADLATLLGRQIAWWCVYWLLLSIPFFLGASAIVLSLMAAHAAAPAVYGVNLLGSAAGAVLATLLMYGLHPAWLAAVMGAVTIVAGFSLRPGKAGASTCPTDGNSPAGMSAARRPKVQRWMPWALFAGVAAIFLIVEPPRLRIDRYKIGAYVRQLAAQGEAERVAVRYGPRAMIEAYRSEFFHDLPFLTGGIAPPRITMLLADAERAGAVLEASTLEEAAVVEQTVMSFAFAVASQGRKNLGQVSLRSVLLLGEVGGSNVWLAGRMQADNIHVVQPDVHFVSLLQNELLEYGGQVLSLPNVHVHLAEPRDFVEHTLQRFDLIQLVAAEGTAAGSHGLGGLSEDHLMTVEGMIAALGRLTERGVLTVTRGIQTPPRDNLKLLAMFSSALRRLGVDHPDQHVVIVRDFLAVCTLVRLTPWTDEEVEQIRRAYRQRRLTPVWFPGITTDELNRPDALPGPPDSEGDWFHHGAVHLLGDEAEAFIREWPFDISPPTDNRPYFLNFFKLASIGELRRAFGDLWLTRMELAFPLVVAAIVLIAVAALILTFVPLLFLRTARRVAGWPVVLGYFAAIGLGYLLLEMTFLSRVTRWVGDPITAAAVTIAGFLVMSGLGSLAASRIAFAPDRKLRPILGALLAVGVVELLVLVLWVSPFGAYSFAVRCGLSFIFFVPLAFLMGFPMPLALARLERGNPSLIPWAWAINGFASVMAAPLAAALSMTWGYYTVGVIALLLYVFPGLFLSRLPGRVA